MQNTEMLCPGCMSNNGGKEKCEVCGFDAAAQNPQGALGLRAWILDRYMIGKVLSQNCQGITYLAWDNARDTAVNIIEYYPANACQRNPDMTVSMREEKKFFFNEGLLSFVEIYKKLIGSELPSVWPVYSVFEENGTAYAVIANISGITLQDFLNRNGGSLKWEQARPLFLPLIDTLIGLHSENIIHGGISPETIIVGRDGKLRLSGLVIPSLRVVTPESPAELYNGFAAIEQYGAEDLAVDKYTDVYGLSATIFRLIIGTVPPSATARMESDNLSIPAKFADELPRQFLVALANGMQLMPADRTATVEVFKNELVYGETKENIQRAEAHRRQEATKVKAVKEKKEKSSLKYATISAIATVGLFVVIGVILGFIFKDEIFGTSSEPIVNSDIASMPSVESIGDVDSEALESKILYDVPDFSGKYYHQIKDNEEYERFKIVIDEKKVHSDKFAKGTVCAQSVEAGTGVEKDTEIVITISLGAKEFKMTDVVGLDEQSAKIELLKQGFLYENIEVAERYDEDARPNVIIGQSPESSSTVNSDVHITIYKNSYTGEEEIASE